MRADQVKLTHCWFIFLRIKELFIGGNGGKKKKGGDGEWNWEDAEDAKVREASPK